MKSNIKGLIIFGLLSIIFACASGRAITHIEIPSARDCVQCHTDERVSLSHTEGFISRHGVLARGMSSKCNVCHRVSFCNDCHSGKEEMKPSDKYKESPWRELPHRGDYITQHMIDGKIDPTSCFTCHGRKNNERCRTCHR